MKKFLISNMRMDPFGTMGTAKYWERFVVSRDRYRYFGRMCAQNKDGQERRLTNTTPRDFNRYNRPLLEELLQLGGWFLERRNQIGSTLIS